MTRYLCALTACDLSAADLALAQCRHVADTSHVRAATFATDLMRAGRALGDGRLDDLQALIPEFWLRSAVELPTESYAWANYYARLLDGRGNLQLLAKLDLDALGSRPERTSKHDTYFAIGRANIYTRLGRLDAARALLAQIPASDLTRMPVQYGDPGALCDLVTIYSALGDMAAARRLYPQLEPFAHLNAVGPSFEYRGAVAHYLGLLARSLGHEADARRHFETAVEINRALGMGTSGGR
jgi:tetratricopeptide (TPR) repeat protein